MPVYLTRFSYTPETRARMIENPEDRRAAAQAYIESVGGTLHGFWYAVGEHDAINLWEAPDNVSMAAVALAITGGGALSSLETTVLLTVDETLEALRKAQQVSYYGPTAIMKVTTLKMPARNTIGMLARPAIMPQRARNRSCGLHATSIPGAPDSSCNSL